LGGARSLLSPPWREALGYRATASRPISSATRVQSAAREPTGRHAYRLLLAGLLRQRIHFPPQVDGDLVRDGVCSLYIANKLGVSQPTAAEHLKILERAGLIEGKRIKQWVFYRRQQDRIDEVKHAFQRDW
jgi:DNA-binding transcriptional ArsR family regulator